MTIGSSFNNLIGRLLNRAPGLQSTSLPSGWNASPRSSSSTASAERRSSVGPSYPETNTHMQRLVSAQRRVDNFAAAEPRDQVAMLLAMDPHDAAMLLDGTSFEHPDQAVDLFCQIQEENGQKAEPILEHLSNNVIADVFKVPEDQTTDAPNSRARHEPGPNASS